MIVKVIVKIILVFIFNLCLVLNFGTYLYSQKYTEFNFQDGIWIEEEYVKEFYIRHRKSYCKGDTTIDGHLYYKLYETTVSSYYPGLYPDTVIHKYIGAIREDDSKHILFRNFIDTAEIPIYDFNLKLGDTISLFSQNIIISAIDSVDICGKIRKRFTLSGPSYHEDLIEGIGYSTGLLGYLHHQSRGESFNRLECYTEMNNSLCSECEFILQHKNEIISSVVYPNPAHDKLSIHTSKCIFSVKLLDLMGNPIRFESNIESLYYTIDLVKLESGSYVLVIQFCDKTNFSSLVVKE